MACLPRDSGGRDAFWIAAVGVIGVTLRSSSIYKGTLAPSMRAVVPIEHEGSVGSSP
jgi:hypothetical protein